MKNLVSKVLAIIAVSLILCQQHSGRFEIVQDGMIGMSSHENRFSELAIALIGSQNTIWLQKCLGMGQ